MSQIHPFPHHYSVFSTNQPDSEVMIAGEGLPTIASLPPEQFGGPGDHWSPETLLLGALSSCFALTFRAIARHRGLEWLDLRCQVDGVLEREQGDSRFTQYQLTASLTIPSHSDVALAEQVLSKAKSGCLISSSLNGAVELRTDISVE